LQSIPSRKVTDWTGLYKRSSTQLYVTMSRKEEADRSKIRVGVMHGKILPHFQIRRDKRLIKDEVSVYQTGLTVKLYLLPSQASDF
jgi:hypothetical protein